MSGTMIKYMKKTVYGSIHTCLLKHHEVTFPNLVPFHPWFVGGLWATFCLTLGAFTLFDNLVMSHSVKSCMVEK